MGFLGAGAEIKLVTMGTVMTSSQLARALLVLSSGFNSLDLVLSSIHSLLMLVHK